MLQSAIRKSITICLLLTPLLMMWVGSYFYFRTIHSSHGQYASAPIGWRTIHYDTHYRWAKPMYYLHLPLIWFERSIIIDDLESRLSDYQGNRANYDSEDFN